MATDANDATTSGPNRPVATDNFHIDLPKPQFEPIHPPNLEASSPESSQDDTPSGEDLQMAVGVSISRAQTHMASPKTPAAEKIAAMEELEGLFADFGGDGADTLRTRDEPEEIEEMAYETPRTPEMSSRSPTIIPSPWKASPKVFDKPKAKTQEEAYVGILPDVNLRKYIPSFPSLSRVSTFRESVPSLGSILGSVRSRSPVRKSATRNRRATTVVDCTAESERSPMRQHSSEKDRPKSAGNLGTIQEGRSHIAQNEKSSHAPEASLKQNQRPEVIRRSTSDQSLCLRRVQSTTTSLGDDSRFEGCSEQVNSRHKAFKDSLQDSSFKRYGIANLPNFSFRPDFLRSRANSDPKPKTLASQSADRTNPPLSLSSQEAGARREKIEPGPFSEYPNLDKALKRLTGDLVILGGYRGSILRSAKPPNKQMWVPLKAGLNMRKVNLEVGLNPEDEERMEDTIYADGMLSHIGPVDMGRRLLKKICNCSNVKEGKLRLHEYGYDWRLSPHLLSRRLIEFLEKLPSNRYVPSIARFSFDVRS